MLIRSVRSKLDEDGAFDSGFDDNGPFRVTPEAGGVSLESALRDYGPAAIDDLIPRLRAIAHILDTAHGAGHVHGALHPSKVIVHDDATSLVAGRVPIAPYAAPETADGPPTKASDQYALAAIAYEWLFGRPIERPADRPVEVRTMPGVDRVRLSKAFTRALAPNPAARFASCNDFCSAVADAVVPAMPLLAFDDDDPVGPFVPERLDQPASFDSGGERASAAPGSPGVDDLKIITEEAPLAATTFDSQGEEPVLTRDEPPDLDAIDPIAMAPVASWNPDAVSRPAPRESQRFGGFALILATIVGSIFGFAAGYMARPRALQSGPVQEIAQPKPTENAVAAPEAAVAAPAPAPSTAKGAGASAAPANAGRLLVRSTPSGASVSVDGVAQGVTPAALRDLPMGARTIVVARRGYIPETRRVVITSARPSRSLDVRLAAEAAAPPRPTTSASAVKGRSGEISPKPAATTGALSIDSRPGGAAVTINGTPSGTTPLLINDLAPGEYRILMAMPGYRNFATTVRVVAGERVRAAASLTALEQQ